MLVSALLTPTLLLFPICCLVGGTAICSLLLADILQSIVTLLFYSQPNLLIYKSPTRDDKLRSKAKICPLLPITLQLPFSNQTLRCPCCQSIAERSRKKQNGGTLAVGIVIDAIHSKQTWGCKYRFLKVLCRHWGARIWDPHRRGRVPMEPWLGQAWYWASYSEILDPEESKQEAQMPEIHQ